MIHITYVDGVEATTRPRRGLMNGVEGAERVDEAERVEGVERPV
jgi:hypothetical protein